MIESHESSGEVSGAGVAAREQQAGIASNGSGRYGGAAAGTMGASRPNGAGSGGPSFRRQQLLIFARNFFKHPRMLGSLIPSSHFLIDKLLARVEWQKARVIVEYGPGVGSFTTEILRRMRPDATLIALDVNQDFITFLRQSVHDPRLHALQRSAEDIAQVLRELGHQTADYVISGIPFSTMPAAVKHNILKATRAALAPHGKFLVYQFSSHVLPDLQASFGPIEQDFELLNIPPIRMFACSQRTSS